MTDEEKIEVGQRIKEFLRSEGYNQADAAREFSPRVGISFKAAEVKISRLINGHFESDEDFFIYLYEKFRANIGFLLTGKGIPHVKSLE